MPSFNSFNHLGPFDLNLLSCGNVPDLHDSCFNLTGSQNHRQRNPRLLTILKLVQHLWILFVAVLGSDVPIPQLSDNFHPLLRQVLLRGDDVHVRVHRADLLLLLGHVGLHDAEESLYADTDAHARHGAALGVKHAHEAVVATSPGHAAHADLLPGLVLGVSAEDGLVDDPGVVVQASRQAEVEADGLPAPVEVAVVEQQLHLLQPLLGNLALRQLAFQQLLDELGSPGHSDKFSKPVSSVISFLTSSQGLLSNLSTELQMVLNMSAFTPQTSKIPSKIILWFNLITKGPTSTELRISLTILTHSASGIMAS